MALYTDAFVVNLSSCVDAKSASLMSRACNNQLGVVAKAWNLCAPVVRYVGTKDDLAKLKYNPAETWLCWLIDTDSSEPDALAYHTNATTPDHGVVCRILCKTILDNGGVLLFKDASTDTVAAALSHELIEALVDPLCTFSAQDQNNGGRFVALEACDPVQNGIVQVNVDGQVVGLSNFVHPLYFANDAPAGSDFDFMGQLSAPFTIASGGYISYFANGQWSQTFGKRVPQWKVEAKKVSHRLRGRKHGQQHQHQHGLA